MSSKPLQLVGEVDAREEVLADLDAKLKVLRSDLEDAKRDFHAALMKVERKAIVSLLGVLEAAMRDVASGKFDLSSVQLGEQSDSKWDVIKQRLAPRLREAVDILIIQKSMKRTELAAAMKMDYSNCSKNVITVLVRQGLLIDNGRDGVRLKEL